MSHNRREFIKGMTVGAAGLMVPSAFANNWLNSETCKKYGCETPPAIDAKLDPLRKHFRYRLDGRNDRWHILHDVLRGRNVVGDCEDFALTALMLLCDWNGVEFWQRLVRRQSELIYCKAPDYRGRYGPHAILKWDDQWLVDNGTPKGLQPWSYYNRKGYQWGYAYEWHEVRNMLLRQFPKQHRKALKRAIDQIARNA